MDAEKALRKYKSKVDARLLAFFDDKISKAEKIDDSSKQMIQLLKDYTMRGGKRIRAALVYYGCLCFAEEDKKTAEQLIDASMCVELIQSYLLIHDDIIDNDDLRRGGPSLHASYREFCRNNFKTNPEHFGVSMAICAGDLCFAFANEIITKTKFDPSNKIKALQSMNHTVHQVIYGQVLDVLSSIKDEFAAKDIMKMQELKTATYTIEGPLHIGALLVGANEEELELLSDYAIPLGIAFQIQDDILGIFGDEKKLGKPVGSDIKEGKKTLLMLKALESANEDDKSFIKSRLGKPVITADDVKRFQRIIKETGALEYCQKTTQDMLNTSKKVIEQSHLRSKGKEFVIGIADFMIKRDF